jgi:PAS domain S-box-containing protein
MDVNDAFLRMTGYERVDVIGRTFFGLDLWASESDRRSLEDAMRPATSLVGLSTKLRTPTGRVRNALISMDPLEADGKRFVLLIARDVTSQRREEEGRARLASIVESTDDAIIAEGLDGKIFAWNRGAERMFGYAAREAIGRPARMIVAPDRITETVSITDRVTRGEHVQAFDTQRVRRDGTRVDVSLAVSPIADERGGIVGASAIARDVTKQRRVQEELSQAFDRERKVVERLVALDQMRNTFLQAVSHELRTPLASIVGMAVTLERDELRPTEEQTREFARLIATNARKLESMVMDLLDVERLERGILEPRRSRADVGELVRRIVGACEPLRGREVHVEAASLLADVDVPKVERIVENLLTNAARHTPATACVWVSVERQEGGVLLSVVDDGPGIAPALRDQVFQPFEQGNIVHAEAPGLGIGLSLVSRFAQLHGGRAWVEDRPGGGSAFRVYLPSAGACDAA